MLNARTMSLIWGGVMASLLVIGIGAGQGLSYGVLLALPLVPLSLWVCRRADPGGRLDLVTIFYLGLSVRWVIATLIQLAVYNTRPGLFGPDELFYDQLSRYMGEYFAGHVPPIEEFSRAPLFSWVNGGIYYLVGPGALAPKMLAGVAGAWTAVLAALIAGHGVSSAASRRAGILAAVFPSLVLWSSLMLKDPWTLLGNEIALLGLLRLRERVRPGYLVLFAGGLALVGLNRPYSIVFVLLTVPFAILLSRQGGLRNVILLGTVSVIVFLIYRAINPTAIFTGDGESSGDTLERVNFLRSAYTTDAGSAVNIGAVDTSTPLGVLLWAPLGLMYYFLAPIPFTGTSILSLSTSPEMIVWYTMLPSVFRGLRDVIRTRTGRTLLPLVIYTALSSVIWSSAVTNVGSLYRYRSQVLFVLLILAAADQIRRRDARLAAADALRLRPRPRADMPPAPVLPPLPPAPATAPPSASPS